MRNSKSGSFHPLTKVSGSHSPYIIETHGEESWELDALQPKVLNRLLASNIEKYLDKEKFEEIKQKEEEDKKKLKKFAGETNA